METAPSAAAAQSTTRSRLDSARVVRASDTLAQSANPAARKLSQERLDSPRENSGNRPEKCGYAVSRDEAQPLDPAMHSWIDTFQPSHDARHWQTVPLSFR